MRITSGCQLFRWTTNLPLSQSPQPEKPTPVLDLTRNYPVGVPIPSPVTGEIEPSDVVVAWYFAIMVVNSGIVIVSQFNCVDNCNFRDATAQAPDDAKVEALRYAYFLIGAKPPVLAPLAEQAIVQGLENLQNTLAGFKDVFREEMDQVRADFRSLGEKVDGMAEDVIKMRSELTTVTQFMNAQRIEKTVQSNMMRARPEGLHQVPGPNGSLPWNTSIQGPTGEEIVLKPLVSLEDVQTLDASQLGAYVQFYYPETGVPENLQERRKRVLMAIGRSREAYSIEV
ncbi:hypothetical protein V8D89_002525 [Ganoderma adspersum]